jgi:hypothetical protein
MFCAPGLIFDGTRGAGSGFHVLCSRNRFGRYRRRRVPFSCFMLTDSFGVVPKARGLIFMFCALGMVWGRTKGGRAHFQVFRSRTCFWRYRGRRVPFSYFALPDSFWEVPWAMGPVFMFCAPGLVFDNTEGIGSHFHSLPSRTIFGRFRRRRVRFSCFAISHSFWAAPGAPSTVFLFCAPGLVLGGTEGACVTFSCFALPDSFRAVSWAMGLVFMFCVPGLVFDSTEGVGSCFHSLRSRTLFGRYRGRRVPFSFFVLSHSFWAPSPVFMFCTPGLVWGCTEGAGPHFHVLRSRNRLGTYQGRQVPFSSLALPDPFLAIPRASGPVVMFYAPGLVLGGTVGVRSSFHVLRSRTRLGKCRGRRVPFTFFALLDSFSAITGAFGPIFIFFAPGIVLGGTKGVGVPFSCFAIPDSFRAVPRVSSTVFKFCAPRLVFNITEGVVSCFKVCGVGLFLGCIEGVRSRLHVLRSQTHFQRYRGRRIPFSFFALSDSFWVASGMSGSVFMFCAPGLILGGTGGVESRFHVCALGMV